MRDIESERAREGFEGGGSAGRYEEEAGGLGRRPAVPG